MYPRPHRAKAKKRGKVKRHLWSFAAVLVLATTLLAADGPAATSIGPHQMGESFDKWLALNGMDLQEICAKKHPRGSGINYKSTCQRLTAIKVSGWGEFYLGFQGNQVPFRWYFSDGHLSECSIKHIAPDVDQQISFLVAKYGEPASRQTVAYQNAYGAKWDCLEANWRMPDGVVIQARETVDNVPIIHFLTVTFYTQYRLAELEKATKTHNPYDP
jgi:hypothetical protein